VSFVGQIRVTRGTPAVPASPGARGRRLSRAGLRAFGIVLVGLLATLITFAIGFFSSVSPAALMVGPAGTTKQIAAVNHSLGLDRSFFVQYGTWLWHALHGNLGRSYFSNESVGHDVVQRLAVDASIIGFALIMIVVVGFAAGITAAVHRDGWIDRGITALNSVAQAIPEFWFGIIVVIIFAVRLKWLPASGYTPPSEGVGQWLLHVILPGITLGLPVAAVVARQLRAALITELGENYVTGATVRGLGQRRILYKHVLRNAAAPAVASVGLAIPQLLGGAVIVETVFALPGLGQYALQATEEHDLPVVQGVLLVSIAFVLIGNLLTDLIVAALRPTKGG
jgi:peptide/nickel transport system permease protein